MLTVSLIFEGHEVPGAEVRFDASSQEGFTIVPVSRYITPSNAQVSSDQASSCCAADVIADCIAQLRLLGSLEAVQLRASKSLLSHAKPIYVVVGGQACLVPLAFLADLRVLATRWRRRARGGRWT